VPRKHGVSVRYILFQHQTLLVSRMSSCESTVSEVDTDTQSNVGSETGSFITNPAFSVGPAVGPHSVAGARSIEDAAAIAVKLSAQSARSVMSEGEIEQQTVEENVSTLCSKVRDYF
jgi:hypothetical protein